MRIVTCKSKYILQRLCSNFATEGTWQHLIWLLEWTLEWHIQVWKSNRWFQTVYLILITPLAGVAYASPSTARQTPRVIQRWPGRSHRDESKVLTRLVYNLDGRKEKEATVSLWGFQCNETERKDLTKKLRDWFKLLLESEYLIQKNQALAEAGHPTQSEADVTRWLEDYLSNIYRQIEQEISRRYTRPFWETSTVVFIFSLPTTWRSHAMIERKFKHSILRAGFGSAGPNHTVELGLTEAEAAAVYTADAGQLYQVGLFIGKRGILLTWSL